MLKSGGAEYIISYTTREGFQKFRSLNTVSVPNISVNQGVYIYIYGIISFGDVPLFSF